MWLERPTILFLSVGAMVISGEGPVTLDTEKERNERVPKDSPLSLNCTIPTAGYLRYRMSWFFIPSNQSTNKTHNLSVRIFDKSPTTSDVRDPGETVYNVTPSSKATHSGWYFCSVTAEIPHYIVNDSHKTEVTIMTSMEHTTHLSLPIFTATVSSQNNVKLVNWWLWVALGISSFFLAFLLLVCLLLSTRCRIKRGEDPVYVNTRPAKKQPSPRPSLLDDNQKMVSSSVHLQTLSPGEDARERSYKKSHV